MSPRDSTEIDFAQQARRSLFVVRQKLLNPTGRSLESCGPYLRTAIDCMARLQGRMQKAGPRQMPELRTEVSALRLELAQVNALMQNAGAFHAALAQLLTPQDDSICYAAGGVIPDRPQPTLRLEG